MTFANLQVVTDAAPPSGERLPLLLLPGTVCDARLFAPMMAELDDVTAQVIDMTGANTTPDLAAKILAAAPPRFSLLGFSLGGIVALEIMAQAPHRVDRLALINTTPRPDPIANAATRRTLVATARANGMDGYILDNWQRLVSPVNLNRADLREVICAMARDAGTDELASQSEVAIHRSDSRPRLPAIAVPTLILAGEHEQICPLEAHRELADGIPGAEYHLIANAGHYSLLENAVTVAGHVRRWIDGAPHDHTSPIPQQLYATKELS